MSGMSPAANRSSRICLTIASISAPAGAGADCCAMADETRATTHTSKALLFTVHPFITTRGRQGIKMSFP
jgi:hypothetical protein